MILPKTFTANLRPILDRLGEGESAEFFDALQNGAKANGLRVNTLKIRPGESAPLFGEFGECLEPVPWCADGFYYYDAAFRPSKHPLYQAGLYYLQEPSAMAPATLLNALPGEKVLDLCAAPGGKSTQLAMAMAGAGVLVANEPSATRGRALVKNLTLCGVRNAVVLNEMPHRLAERFGGYFDRILADAPCSGEGMFRKNPDAVKAWSENKPKTLVPIQQNILANAAKMLKPGGIIAYSTCTFNTLENEEMILDFLSGHEDFEPVPPGAVEGFSAGLLGLPSVRIWPHRSIGEGHFVCLLRKNPGESVGTWRAMSGRAHHNSRTRHDRTRHAASERKHANSRTRHAVSLPTAPSGNGFSAAPQIFRHFCGEFLTNTDMFEAGGEFRVIDVKNHLHLYMLPAGLPELAGLRVARSGWYLGVIKKARRGDSERFEPSHAFAMGLKPGDVRYICELPQEKAASYLRGESLDAPDSPGATDSLGAPDSVGDSSPASSAKPWMLMCLHGYGLGWARLVNGRLKNKKGP